MARRPCWSEDPRSQGHLQHPGTVHMASAPAGLLWLGLSLLDEGREIKPLL